MMGSGCTKTETGDVQQPPLIETVDGEQANGTHSADSKKGVLINNQYHACPKIHPLKSF